MTTKPKLFIYVLLFPNGKRYVGVSRNWMKRWSGKFGKAITPVQKAIKHFGIENVRQFPLEYGERSCILELERLLIEKWKLTNRAFGYNCTLGGEESPMHSPLVVAKRSATIKGRPATEAQKASAKEVANRPETLARLRELGRKVMSRPEVQVKIAIARTTPEYHALRSALTIEQDLGASRRGVTNSEEHCAKLHEAWERRKASGEPVWTPAAIAAQTAGRTGKKRDKKTKARMKKANQATWDTATPEQRARHAAACAAGQKRRRERERAEAEDNPHSKLEKARSHEHL